MCVHALRNGSLSELASGIWNELAPEAIRRCPIIEEIRARGGPTIALTTEGNTELERIVDDVLYIPKTLEMLTPILVAIPLQFFAYYTGVMKGYDVDKPRNLAKSVTVE